MTVDPFVLRGAAVGAAWRAEQGGAAGAVYHAVGSGPLPIASGIPVVVTLLDLAPWELPEAFGRTRRQPVRPAPAGAARCARRPRWWSAVTATARAARRVLRIRRDRLHVVPLAPRPGFSPADRRPVGQRRRRRRVRPRVCDSGSRAATSSSPAGSTRASTSARSSRPWPRSPSPAGRPGSRPDVPWPPRILVVGASPDDRASVARAAARKGIGESLVYAPALPPADLVELVRGARAAILPVISEAAGLPGHRGARLRHPGRRVRGRATPRADRSGRASSSSRATRTASPSRSPRSGPTTASTTGSPRLALEGARARVTHVGGRRPRDAGDLRGGRPPPDDDLARARARRGGRRRRVRARP